jgi:hypothetical protein
VVHGIFDRYFAAAPVSLAQLPSVILVLAWLVVMRSTRSSGWRAALLSIPGTVLHEAAHLFVGLLFFAKPVSINLIPRRRDNHWVLGSVSANLNFFNAVPVAFAPLLLIGMAWLLLELWLHRLLRLAHMRPGFLAGMSLLVRSFRASHQ